MRARSRRIAALTTLMLAPAFFAACTDTTPTGVESRHPAAAAPPRSASASQIEQLGDGALVFGTSPSANALQAALEAMGKTVTRSATLPADPRPYKTIWFVDKTTPLSTDDVRLLRWFLDQGGGVYLSGDGLVPRPREYIRGMGRRVGRDLRVDRPGGLVWRRHGLFLGRGFLRSRPSAP